jgi:hypothetical protein
MAGEPIITEKATAIPKIIPTMIKRLFIPKIFTTQLKMDCETLGRYGRMF